MAIESIQQLGTIPRSGDFLPIGRMSPDLGICICLKLGDNLLIRRHFQEKFLAEFTLIWRKNLMISVCSMAKFT